VEGIFSLCHYIQTSSGVHPTFYAMSTMGFFLEGVKLKLITHFHLVLSGAMSPLTHVFMAWYFVKHRNNFTFHIYKYIS
jgi:hypothetical protein